MDKFKIDTQYLVTYPLLPNPMLIEITDVTEKCYKVLRQNGFRTWEMKDEMDNDWKIIEELSEKRPIDR